MSETEAVKEARRWRREVYEQTRNLTVAQRRAREDELLRAVREAGVEFEDVFETGTDDPAEWWSYHVTGRMPNEG